MLIFHDLVALWLSGDLRQTWRDDETKKWPAEQQISSLAKRREWMGMGEWDDY
jgi:hypothetical protein